jgi:hypothetical protein
MFKIKLTDPLRNLLAWVSLGLAVVGGAAASTCFVGGLISGIVGALWDWVPLVLSPALFIVWLCDLLNDGIPNRLALWTTMLLPSVNLAIHGRLGAALAGWSHALNAQVDQTVGSWVGQSSMVAVTFVCAFGALWIAHKFPPSRKNRTSGMVGPGVPAGHR